MGEGEEGEQGCRLMGHSRSGRPLVDRTEPPAPTGHQA